MQGLMHMEGGEQVLPFGRLFYSSPSSFLWEDSMGTVHHIPQGEGGEQGDPLMPLLYALGQHSALVAVSERLRDDEILFAFLDDLYVKTSPERAVEAHRILSEELWWHAKIRLNQGKTCIWNQVGQMPIGCERLEAAARAENPDARVWRGDLQMEAFSERNCHLGHSRGHSRVRPATVGAEGGRTRNVSPTDPRVDGPPMCLVAPLVLRRCSGEFLSAHRQPCVVSFVRDTP